MNEFLDRVAEVGPDLAVRATVLFVLACGLSLALIQGSAAQRHLVWGAALAGSLALPVIYFSAPKWRVLPTQAAERIEARLRSILANDSNRNPVGAWRLALVTSLFATLVTVTAVIGPAVAQEKPAPSSPSAKQEATDVANASGDTNAITKPTPEAAKDEPRVSAAWRKFCDSGKYQSVLTASGKIHEHYGLTDEKEFFAEMTESCLSKAKDNGRFRPSGQATRSGQFGSRPLTEGVTPTTSNAPTAPMPASTEKSKYCRSRPTRGTTRCFNMAFFVWLRTSGISNMPTARPSSGWATPGGRGHCSGDCRLLGAWGLQQHGSDWSGWPEAALAVSRSTLQRLSGVLDSGG